MQSCMVCGGQPRKNPGAPFFDCMKKNTGGCISNNNKFFKKIKGIEKVSIIGHSLGKSDFPYFKYLNKMLPGAIWTYYFYKPDKHRNSYVKKTFSSLHISPKCYYIRPVDDLLINRKNKSPKIDSL